MAGRLFSFFLREEPRIYDDLRCVGIVVRGSGERLGCPTALFFFFFVGGTTCLAITHAPLEGGMSCTGGQASVSAAANAT